MRRIPLSTWKVAKAFRVWARIAAKTIGQAVMAAFVAYFIVADILVLT
jgi:hypothetical protein